MSKHVLVLAESWLCACSKNCWQYLQSHHLPSRILHIRVFAWATERPAHVALPFLGDGGRLCCESASNQHHCLYMYTNWFNNISLIIIISYSIQTLHVLKAQILPDYLARLLRSQHVHRLCKARDSLVLKEHILSAGSVCFSLIVFR